MRKLHIFLLALLLPGCAEEKLRFQTDGNSPDGIIEFAHKEFERVDISTRYSMPASAEARVINLYAMVFDAEGKRQAAHFFDNSERQESADAVMSESNPYAWWIDERDPSAGASNYGLSWGKLKMHLPDMTGGTIYLFANLDFSLLNFSKSALDAVRTKAELENYVCSYLNPTLERIGTFLMIGHTAITVEGPNITLGSANEELNGTYSETQNGGSVPLPKRLLLERVDAKVQFKVGIVPGAVTTRTETHELTGQVYTSHQRIESFTPTSWQVFNVPKGSYLLPHDHDASDELTGGYFNSMVLPFETTEQGVHCTGYNDTDVANNTPVDKTRNEYGFVFYTLENRHTPTNSVYGRTDKYPGINPYHLRDKRSKTAAGVYDTEAESQWEFAPEYSAYVVIKGDLGFHYDEDGQTDTQTLFASATYVVHLGDFGSSSDGSGTKFDDYSLCRNTHYTYTLNIKGIDKVELEVTKDGEGFSAINEEQSGHSGSVVLSQEKVYIFDAHYSQRVYMFNARKILNIAKNPGDLTWAVETPFGRNGKPYRVGEQQIEVPDGLDYKWVHFMKNSKAESYVEPHGDPATGGELEVGNPLYPNYCQYHRIYPGSGSAELMDIMSLCQYLREQTALYYNNMSTNPSAPHEGTDFDPEGNLAVTAFIDEFYYDHDPISEETRSSLWHEFVNKPMRSMHIMCSATESVDGSSSTTGTAITIRQRAIQSIYSSYSPEGWGSETVDELGSTAYFEPGHTRQGAGNNAPNSTKLQTQINAYSTDNGLYNTALLWEVTTDGNANPDANPNSPSTLNPDTKYWAEYLDYIRVNDQLDEDRQVRMEYLRNDPERNYLALRYSCMMRNRDENGDGVIDLDEIKWYMASVGQLQYLFVGDAGLSVEARLYNSSEKINEKSTLPDNIYWLWRIHPVSSTIRNGWPIIVWAEEGISTGPYLEDNKWSKAGAYSVRCVRNLEENSATPRNVQIPGDTPLKPVEVTHNADGTYTFDLRRINSLSKRIKSQTELLPLDENSSMARLYDKFETGPECNSNGILANGYRDWPTTLKPNLEKGIPVCPEGYRAPNIREMVVMYLNVPSTDHALWGSGNTYWWCCNSYSFGSPDVGGNGFDAKASEPAYSWFFSITDNISLNPSQTNLKSRCVRDVD